MLPWLAFLFDVLLGGRPIVDRLWPESLERKATSTWTGSYVYSYKDQGSLSSGKLLPTWTLKLKVTSKAVCSLAKSLGSDYPTGYTFGRCALLMETSATTRPSSSHEQ
ncbi:hypothetical protein PR003_g9931 [Phytophthora rubi]|uniref:Uncharacterized protein n=1 Tax=Phytophthora rubi TaxID=129364 RepID=A0A6A4FEX4_9STRA|nr:hypothetical protein PR001_g9484 [Phytophthora rubi]KAE9341544.1 hypothetical protein PR003_g9931 [Phytophthora rubi]